MGFRLEEVLVWEVSLDSNTSLGSFRHERLGFGFIWVWVLVWESITVFLSWFLDWSLGFLLGMNLLA